MIPFILFKEKDKNGNIQQYVLQREYPNYIGVISYRPIETALIQHPIANYNLWVIYSGTLKGNQIPLDKMALKDADDIYFNMAAWFYTEMDVNKYENYKIKTNATATT